MLFEFWVRRLNSESENKNIQIHLVLLKLSGLLNKCIKCLRQWLLVESENGSLANRVGIQWLCPNVQVSDRVHKLELGSCLWHLIRNPELNIEEEILFKFSVATRTGLMCEVISVHASLRDMCAIRTAKFLEWLLTYFLSSASYLRMYLSILLTKAILGV